MAAAIIPMALTLAPQLFNLIAGLVHKHAPVAEAQFGAGTGPVKLADVFTKVITDLQNAAVAGTIDKNLPSDELIKTIIQSVVSSLNLQGQLGGATASVQPIAGLTAMVAASPQKILVASGQTITIVGK